MLVEPQCRRVRFKTDVLQRDLLDQFVSLSYGDHKNDLHHPATLIILDSRFSYGAAFIYIIPILGLWEYY